MRRISLSFLTIALSISCNENNTDLTNNNNPAPGSTDSPAPTPSEDNQKSKGELILDGVEYGINAVQDGIERKHIKDSIKLANKEKMYAYQVGLETTDKDELFKTYNALPDAVVANVYVLKKSRKEYVLVKYEGKPEQQLSEEYESIKLLLPAVESLKIVDLNSFCGKNELVKKGEKLSRRKNHVEIPCLICN